jgi:hypothetical protein
VIYINSIKEDNKGILDGFYIAGRGENFAITNKLKAKVELAKAPCGKRGVHCLGNRNSAQGRTGLMVCTPSQCPGNGGLL